ncbi:hypothetical protein ACLM5H_12810 [Fredinandcohnia humi]
MKRMICKLKYHWHSFQYKKNQVLYEDCLCNDVKIRIATKMNYHERKAIHHITKL